MIKYLLLRRLVSDTESTVSELSLITRQDSEVIKKEFLCFILEDQHQDKKVYAETRIPAGNYQIKFRTKNSMMNEKYKDKYPFHKGMLEIRGVPNFTDIYIHTGNTDDDTKGCLLTGYAVVYNRKFNRFEISGGTSTPAYVEVYQLIASHLLDSGTITLLIVDKDRAVDV